MSDPLSPEPQSAAPPQSENVAQLTASNSRVENVIQVTGSPGAVVNQIVVGKLPSTSGATPAFWMAIAVAVLLISSRLTTIIGISPIAVQILAGGVLAGIVWGFFDGVEGILKPQAKTDIAKWLLRVKTSDTAQSWPHLFLALVNRTFGERKLSWTSFWLSSRATFAFVALGLFLGLMSPTARDKGQALLPREANPPAIVFAVLFAVPVLLLVFTITNGIPDYFAFLKTRLALEYAASARSLGVRTIIVALDLAGSMALAMVSSFILPFLNWFVIHRFAFAFPNAPREYLLELGPYMALRIEGTFAPGMLRQFLVLS